MPNVQYPIGLVVHVSYPMLRSDETTLAPGRTELKIDTGRVGS